MKRKGIKFKVSFIVEAEFNKGVTKEQGEELVEEAVTAMVDHEMTGRTYTARGGKTNGIMVKLDDFVNFTAEVE
jgi:hypothetical protein